MRHLSSVALALAGFEYFSENALLGAGSTPNLTDID